MVAGPKDSQPVEQVAEALPVHKPHRIVQTIMGFMMRTICATVSGVSRILKKSTLRTWLRLTNVDKYQAIPSKNQAIAHVPNNHADPERKQGGGDPGGVPTVVARRIQEGDQGLEGPDPGGIFQQDRNQRRFMMFSAGSKV